MEDGQFIILSKSGKLDIKMVVTVRSTGACLPGEITKAKNKVFDMLREQGFDVDKIEFP